MEDKAAQGSAATAQQKKSLTFDQMSPSQKTTFILKLVVSIISFGFIFPNLMD